MLRLLQKKTKLVLSITVLLLLLLGAFYNQEIQQQINPLKIPSISSFLKNQKVIRIDNFPVKSGNLSSRFGMRKDPFSGVNRMHHGIDIAAKKGTNVYPLGDGEVVFSGRKAGYGITVEVRHGNTIISRYAHLKRTLVKKGQLVSKKDVIAEVGNSWRSTGPHLHLEIAINGKNIDPEIFLVNKLASK